MFIDIIKICSFNFIPSVLYYVTYLCVRRLQCCSSRRCRIGVLLSPRFMTTLIRHPGHRKCGGEYKVGTTCIYIYIYIFYSLRDTPPAHCCAGGGFGKKNVQMGPNIAQVGLLLGLIWLQSGPGWAGKPLGEYSRRGGRAHGGEEKTA